MKVFRFLFGLLLLKSMAYLCVPPAVAQDIVIPDPKAYETRDIIKPGDSIPSGDHDTNVAGGDTSTTALIQTKQHNKLSVYPNPASQFFSIRGESREVRIYSISGELILVSNHSRNVPVADLPRGVFILRDEQGGHARLVLQ